MNTYTFDFEFTFMGCHGSFPVTVKYHYADPAVDIMDMYIKGQANNVLFTRLSLYSDTDQWEALREAILDHERARDLDSTIADIARLTL